jgi:prophage antirepressor-like protein
LRRFDWPLTPSNGLAGRRLSTFKFAGLDLRCVTIDGQPWFVASDVRAIIGHTNPTVALRALSTAQKAKKFIGLCEVNVISESGLYTLVMRAQKANPKASEFQAWVTGTVLPAIRKDGMYVQGEEKLDPNNEADLDKFVLTVMERLQGRHYPAH